tara:strand:+ start:3043 stop:3204 length:162 start_codon:yes stop_codon:yes gene_type:complete
MKTAFILLLCSLTSIACVIGAIILALHSIGGWGWFLLIAILTNPCNINGSEEK